MSSNGDTDAPDNMDESSTSVYVFVQAIGTNALLLVVLILVFVFLARKFAYIYTPRLVCPQPSDRRRHPPIVNILSPANIWKMLRTDQHDLIEIIGLDAAMFLRFLALSTKYLSVLTVIACVVLVPVNVYAPRTPVDKATQEEAKEATLLSLTVKDIEEGNNIFWIHTVCVMFATFYLMYLLKHEYFVYVDLRHRYHLSNRDSDLRVDQLSVLLRNLPKDIETDRQLHDYIASLFEDDPVANCSLIKRNDRLHERYDQRTVLVAKLELALANRERKGCDSESDSSIAKMREELENLNCAIREFQREEGTPTRAGFVTFTKFQGAAMATQIPITISNEDMTASSAPEAMDVDWDGVVLTSSERALRVILVYASYALLLLAFEMPVAFITMMTDLDKLTMLMPVLEPLLEASPMVKAQLEGFLPSLGLIIMLAIVPPILRWLSSMIGLASQSEVEQSTFVFFYYFQLVHCIFSATLVSAFLQKSTNLIEIDLQFIFKLLADSLPQANGFYIIMIITRALFSLPLELLRPVALFMGWLGMKRASSASSVRANADPGPFFYDETYPAYLLLISLGVIYFPIAPLIIPFTAFLCMLASVVYRHQFFYVWSRRTESGGAMFPLVFARLLFALVFGHFAMVGILLNKKRNFLALVVSFLIPLTIHFYVEMQKACGNRAKKLVLEDLAQLDQDLRRRSRQISLDQCTSFRNLTKDGESAFKPPWVQARTIDFKAMEMMATDAYPLLQKVPRDSDALRRLVSTEFLLEARSKPSRNTFSEV